MRALPATARGRRTATRDARVAWRASAAKVPLAGSGHAMAWRQRLRLLRLLDQVQRSRPFADDEHPRLLVLRPVPVNLLAEMGDEAAGGHGLHVVLVDLVAARDPPRALEHGDEAIVGMKVRLAEIAGLEAVERDVEPGFGRVAMQHHLVRPRRAGRIAPLVLVGRGVDDGCRVELRELAGGGLDLGAGAGTIADDEQARVLAPRPVPMHLLAEMGNEGAGWHRNAVVRIEGRSAAHPPGAVEDGDEAVVGMEVRLAEVVALEPLVADDVEPRLRRIAYQHRVLRARGGRRIPFDLIRPLVDDRRRIELGSDGGRRGACREYRSNQQETPRAQWRRHSFLPFFQRLLGCAKHNPVRTGRPEPDRTTERLDSACAREGRAAIPPSRAAIPPSRNGSHGMNYVLPKAVMTRLRRVASEHVVPAI